MSRLAAPKELRESLCRLAILPDTMTENMIAARIAGSLHPARSTKNQTIPMDTILAARGFILNPNKMARINIPTKVVCSPETDIK